jgi:hypothetical protein
MTKHHLDAFGIVRVMLGAPEHPLDAFIASTGHFCSETNHWMYRFSENPPRGVSGLGYKVGVLAVFLSPTAWTTALAGRNASSQWGQSYASQWGITTGTSKLCQSMRYHNWNNFHLVDEVVMPHWLAGFSSTNFCEWLWGVVVPPPLSVQLQHEIWTLQLKVWGSGNQQDHCKTGNQDY